MKSTPEVPVGPEPIEDVGLVDQGDLEISAEEADAVTGGTVSSKLKDGKPIGS